MGRHADGTRARIGVLAILSMYGKSGEPGRRPNSMRRRSPRSRRSCSRFWPGMRRVIVAYSGGTDSAYLAWAAHRALGDDAIAITADSASIPESHKRDAEAFARECGFRHEYIETHEFDNPDYVKNDPNRCFHCKDELFTELDASGPRARDRAHRLRRERGRPGRLPARTARRQTAPGGSAAGGCRIDQSRDPRAIAPGQPLHLGPAGLGLPEFANSLRNAR